MFTEIRKLWRNSTKLWVSISSLSNTVQEMEFKSSEGLAEQAKRLPEVVLALNSEVIRLTGKKLVDGIKDKLVEAKSSMTYSRPVGLKEKRLDSSKNVSYLNALDELEGGQRRATDPVWSLKVYGMERLLMNKNEPVLYYLKDGPKLGFIREELQIVPPRTELPPEGTKFENTVRKEFLNRPKKSL